MKINIRQEQPTDYEAVFNLIEKAFANEQSSDHREHFLVERLRKSEDFVPELSLVAEVEGDVVGHILLTKILVKNEQQPSESLALAPVAVHPKFQRNGIGGALIRQAHERAKEMSFRSIILLGHEDYYPRFGYKRADEFGIKLPFDVPKENCLAIELTKDGLDGVAGTVEYPKEFNE